MTEFYPVNPELGAELHGNGNATEDRAYVAHFYDAPDAVGVATVHAAITLPDAGTLDVTTGITNPDMPRIVSITGNAAGITGDVVITGTDIGDGAIVDTIVANGTATVDGLYAFKTVTKITVPAKNAGGDTISIGTAKKIGVAHILTNAAQLLVKLFDGSADSGTMTVDPDAVAKNVYVVNGTPDGVKKLELYYLC